MYKMTKENGKPQIRFAKFKDTWEQRKVSEIAIEKLSNGIMNNQSDDETGVKHINVINMYDTDKIHPEKLTFSNYDEEAVKKCNVEFGDIFLTRSSLKPEGIAEANVLLDSGHFVYDDHLIRLKVNKEKYDPFFVKLNLSGNAFKRQFIVRAKTTAFTTIGQEDISECLGFFPKKEEQQQIGEYFMTLDHLITLHQRKYDKLTKVKKSMLEKMFPKNGANVPESRFKGFTDAWEQRKLGDMGTTFTGLSGKTKEDFGHGDAKFITYMNVFSNPVADLKMTESVEIDTKQNCVKAGDVFFTTSSETPEEVGMSCVMPENADNVYLNSFCFGYRPVEKFDLNYLAYVLRADSFRKEMAFLAQGISRYNISKNKVMDVEIPVPILAEQSKVGQYFRNLDHLITLHQRELEKLKILKKACLEKMFV